MAKKKDLATGKQATSSEGTPSVLQDMLTSLSKRVGELEQKVEELSEVLQRKRAGTRMSTRRKEATKAKILQLFRENGTLDYLDIMEKTDIDLPEIVEACAKLQEEGKVVPVK